MGEGREGGRLPLLPDIIWTLIYRLPLPSSIPPSLPRGHQGGVRWISCMGLRLLRLVLPTPCFPPLLRLVLLHEEG